MSHLVVNGRAPYVVTTTLTDEFQDTLPEGSLVIIEDLWADDSGGSVAVGLQLCRADGEPVYNAFPHFWVLSLDAFLAAAEPFGRR